MLDETLTYTGIILIVMVAGRYRPRRFRLYIPFRPFIGRVGIGHLHHLSLKKSARRIHQSLKCLVLHVQLKDLVLLGPRLAILPTKTLLRLLRHNRNYFLCRTHDKSRKVLQGVYGEDHSILRYNSTVSVRWHRKGWSNRGEVGVRAIADGWRGGHMYHSPSVYYLSYQSLWWMVEGWV